MKRSNTFFDEKKYPREKRNQRRTTVQRQGRRTRSAGVVHDRPLAAEALGHPHPLVARKHLALGRRASQGHQTRVKRVQRGRGGAEGRTRGQGERACEGRKRDRNIDVGDFRCFPSFLRAKGGINLSLPVLSPI